MYIRIPVIAHNVNVMSSAHVTGFPAMTALDGMLHALERQLQANGYQWYFLNWAVVVDQCMPTAGHRRFVSADRENRKRVEASTVDEHLADIKLTLVVEAITDGSSTVAHVNSQLQSPEFQVIFDRLRLSGGRTQIHAKPSNTISERFCVRAFSSAQDAFKTLNRQAFLVEDHTSRLPQYQALIGKAFEDHCAQISDDSEGAMAVDISEVYQPPTDSLQTLMQLISIPKGRLSDQEQSQVQAIKSFRPGGFYVPLAVGFRQLGETRPDPQSRDPSVEFAYAEPVLGVGRLRKLGSVLFAIANDAEHNDETLMRVFWHNPRLDTESPTTNNDPFFVVKSLSN